MLPRETRAEVAGKLEAIIEDLLDDPDWLKNVPEIAVRTYSGRITLRSAPKNTSCWPPDPPRVE